MVAHEDNTSYIASFVKNQFFHSFSVTADLGQHSGGVEQELVRIACFVLGQRIERALEGAEVVIGSFAQRVQNAHQDFAGLSALLRLGPKADLTGDD